MDLMIAMGRGKCVRIMNDTGSFIILVTILITVMECLRR